MSSEKGVYFSDILCNKLVKNWDNNGGTKWYVFEATAKKPKFLKDKLDKFRPKVERIRNEVNSKSDVVSILVNSNKISKYNIDKIKKAIMVVLS